MVREVVRLLVPLAAVRGKPAVVGPVQVVVHTLEDAFHHTVEHHHHVLPRIESLDIALAALLAAETQDSLPVHVFCQLAQDRLSDKMCTFSHSYLRLLEMQDNCLG